MSAPGDSASYDELVRSLIQVGDVLTHTRCMGCFEEHYFTGTSGDWLGGTPTRDTALLDGRSEPVTDIHPRNVTHINRTPVEVTAQLAPSWTGAVRARLTQQR